MQKETIAYPRRTGNQLQLLIPRNMLRCLMGLHYQPENVTTVTISADSTLTVRIDHKDYRLYNEELTFDQLCQSLGNLFQNWFQLFSNGKEKEIIKQIQDLKFIV